MHEFRALDLYDIYKGILLTYLTHMLLLPLECTFNPFSPYTTMTSLLHIILPSFFQTF